MGDLVPVSQPVAGSLLNVVAAAAADPNTDVDKLRALIDLQRLIIADDARVQYFRDMGAAQAEMQPVVRSIPNAATNSKYADLQAVDRAIRPIYAAHGFSLSFSEIPTEGATVRIVCTVLHRAGHSEPHYLEAQADTMGPRGQPNKTPIQGVGSAVSYLRRYLTQMIFNVALTDDNDGNRDDGELLSPVQLRELQSLIRETATDVRRFLVAMGFDVATQLESVRAGEFVRLRTALVSKRDIVAKRAARQTGVAA